MSAATARRFRTRSARSLRTCRATSARSPLTPRPSSRTRTSVGRRGGLVQARLVRSCGAPALHPRRGLCGRRRLDRELLALLVGDVRRRDLPRRRRNDAGGRRGRARPDGRRVPRRDGRPGREARCRRRGPAARPSLRGACLRRLRADRALKATLWTDGGARGNPGPAAFAYVLETEDGTVLDARGEAIGVATNNVAEYSALVAGLRRAAEAGVRELDVRSDSELMVKQMRGEYRVKNRDLQTLFLDASRAARDVGSVSYTHVRREHNELADRLVNEALDAAP